MLTLAPTTAAEPAGLLSHSLTTLGKIWFLVLVSLVLLLLPSPPPPAALERSDGRLAPVFGTTPGSAGARPLLVMFSSVFSSTDNGCRNVFALSYDSFSIWLDVIFGSTVTLTIAPPY